MNIQVLNNNDYPIIDTIREHFTNSNASIHKARNEIKLIKDKEQVYVVKSFKVPHIINKIAYSFFRDSKAKKSYEYSIKIIDFVPKPIGYVEFQRFGLIDDSYFVSENFNYDFTIREPLLDENFENREEIFKAFARFTLELHQQNIFHKDYSPGNILIKKEDNSYIFKIVDINRMGFFELSQKNRAKNFSKLWASDEVLLNTTLLMKSSKNRCFTIIRKIKILKTSKNA